MITRRRTTHGHLTVWFGPKPTTQPLRPPLTPLSGALRAMKAKRRQNRLNARAGGWGSRTGGWRGRGRPPFFRKPPQPPFRSYSQRAPSLRSTATPFPPLREHGSQFENMADVDDILFEQCVAAECGQPDELCGFLDMYGSNDNLFASTADGPSASVEGPQAAAPPLDTVD